MELINSTSKWEATVSAKLSKASADQIWPLFKDYFGISKWFPGLDISIGISGINGKVGCIRYCSGTSFKSVDGSPYGWSKEVLIACDSVQRSFTYELLENNIGFYSYVASFKVIPLGDDGGEPGCVIEWSWSTDPVAGFTLEVMEKDYEANLKIMAKKMEDAVINEHAAMYY